MELRLFFEEIDDVLRSFWVRIVYQVSDKGLIREDDMYLKMLIWGWMLAENVNSMAEEVEEVEQRVVKKFDWKQVDIKMFGKIV